MNTVIVALAAGIAAVGVLTVWSAWTAPPLRRSGPNRLLAVDRDAILVPGCIGALVGLGGVLATGWAVVAVAGAVGGWTATTAWQRRGSGSAEQARVEALAVWCEQLRDLLTAEHGLVGTVEATVVTCPPALRPEVSRLATRLRHQDPAVAVRQFAVDVDDPSGDLVASVLVLAMSRSGRTSELLSELAATIRERASMRVRVEADRAGQRSEARFVIAFTALVMTGIVVFGRGTTFLEPYETSSGQFVLALVFVLLTGGMIWLGRLTRFERPARFLSVGADTDRGRR